MPSLILMLALLSEPAASPDVVVVCPEAFVPALNPLLEYRFKQGHRFVYVPSTWSAEEIRAGIRKVGAKGSLKAVLLIGDAPIGMEKDAKLRAVCTPTFSEPAKINVKFGSEETIASDNAYADLNDDQIPDVAIGRIPVDSADQLTRVVNKIIAYETKQPNTPWRARINMVAGVGGFGGVLDSVIETSTQKLLTDGIPGGYTTHMTYGSWRSPYCPDPRRFHEMTLSRMNEGCLFWVYIGHGHPHGLDKVAVPGSRFHILDCNDCGKLSVTEGNPIAIMLACYTAAFDAQKDCMAEQMLVEPKGPVAVLGGSRVTMPYGMAVLATEMMGEYFENKPATLGEVLLVAKQRSMKKFSADGSDPADRKTVNRALLDGVAGIMSPNGDLEGERREHLLLFHLLGDPLTKLAHPEVVEISELPKEIAAGSQIQVQCSAKMPGRYVVELSCKRGLWKSPLAGRDHFDPSDKGLDKFQDVYLQANDRTYTQLEVDHNGGEFAVALQIPRSAKGPCEVRVFGMGKSQHAIGSAEIYINRLPEKRTDNKDVVPASNAE